MTGGAAWIYSHSSPWQQNKSPTDSSVSASSPPVSSVVVKKVSQEDQPVQEKEVYGSGESLYKPKQEKEKRAGKRKVRTAGVFQNALNSLSASMVALLLPVSLVLTESLVRFR